MVIAGCTGIGVVICRDYNRRIFLLRQIREIFEDMKYYISYQKAAVPEALLRISEKEKPPFSDIFYEIYEDVCAGGSFPDIWKKHMGKTMEALPLSSGEKKLLLEFPSCLGYMDEGAQAGALDGLLRDVEQRMEELLGEQKNKNKMVMSLGLAGGVLLSILLL